MNHSRVKPKKQTRRLDARQVEYDRYFASDPMYKRPGSQKK